MPPIIGNRARGLSGSGVSIGGIDGLGVLGSGTPPFEFGNALDFDGVNDNVSFTQIYSSGGFTLSFWVKLEEAIVYAIGYNIGNRYVRIRTTGEVRLNDDLSTGRIWNFGALSTGVWYHLVITTDGSLNGRCFLNGVESPTGTITANEILVDNFGDRATLDYANMVLDEVAYWNAHYCTPSEAAALYNSGSGEYAYNVIPSPNRYYRLNGSGTDTVAIDSGSDGENGTLNNFTGTYWVTH